MFLDEPVRRALELAWDAFCSGTVPVGAVVSDADGQVLFEGRSRMYEQAAPVGQLARSLLAHAEVNALVRLDPEARHEHLTLTTTLEPCPLCLGALHMATVGRLVFLGSDPYGGAVGRLHPTPHTARVAVSVDGPRQDALGVLASALHVAFYLTRNPTGHVVRTHERLSPVLFAAGREVYTLTLPWRSPRPLAEVLPGLLDVVTPYAPVPVKAGLPSIDRQEAGVVRSVRGRVLSGRGDLAGWMTRYGDAYERVIGARLEPGSLNLALDAPWVMTDPDVRLEPEQAGVGIGFVACRLNGLACWVVRTDKNNRGEGDHPLTVVEVVAETHLRTQLALHDGDAVVLDLPG